MKNKLLLIFGMLLLALPLSNAAVINVTLRGSNSNSSLIHDTYTDTSDSINNGASANLNIFSVGSDRIRAWMTWNMTPINNQCS